MKTNKFLRGFFLVGISLAVLFLGQCTVKIKIKKEDASQRILKERVEAMKAKIDPRIGLRVLQYPDILSKGMKVRSAIQGGSKEKEFELSCKNPSWFFFIDEMPDAHFAHPVRFILMDAVTGEIQEIKADWWPLINEKPIFNTKQSRTDKSLVVFEQLPKMEVNSNVLKPRRFDSSKIKSHDPCDAWAIIVCGYNDLPDTFDEDSDSLYVVLKKLGLADDHIFFVSPHTTHPGVDNPTSIANVQWAINQVASQADETDKVLFFYTSHGNVDLLSCLGSSISASDLATWLNGITCNELSIIIEACHSGSLIGRYADGTYVAAEDNLTGSGETNRCVFTSASSNTSSYPDVDYAGDPNAATDVGSETIYGYIEAFMTPTADVNGDNEISFAEAYQYAWDNDITRINGFNTPQMTTTGLNGAQVFHYCYSLGGTKDLFVSDGPGDVGNNSYDYNSTDIWVTQDPLEVNHQDVVSGMDNIVHVAVHNRGTATVNNVTLKVYWGNSSTALAWPADFNQIGATFNVGSLAAGVTIINTWTWYVDPAIGVGHHFCLVAVADSPEDPMVGCTPTRTYIAPCDNNVGQKNITIVPSHGQASAISSFILANNTREFKVVDLKIEWIGQSWGEVNLLLTDEMAKILSNTKIEGLSKVDLPEFKTQALRFTKGNLGIIRNIPLKSGEKKEVKLLLKTSRVAIGDRSEIRITQMAGRNQIIGVNTIQIRQVDPKDCRWTAKISVSVFADFALKNRSKQAEKISKIFANLLKKGVCGNNDNLLAVMKEVYSLEKQLLEGNLIGQSIAKQFKQGLEQTEKGLDSKDSKLIMQGQSQIVDALGVSLE